MEAIEEVVEVTEKVEMVAGSDEILAWKIKKKSLVISVATGIVIEKMTIAEAVNGGTNQIKIEKVASVMREASGVVIERVVITGAVDEEDAVLMRMTMTTWVVKTKVNSETKMETVRRSPNVLRMYRTTVRKKTCFLIPVSI